MKESISYSFLLNIIILFVFVCAAIVTGIFSYYRAFRAGTAIVNEIEKYEGYNCVSAEAILKKLNGIGYALPFEIKCGSNEKNCIISADGNYKVVSINYNDKFDDMESVDKHSESIFYYHSDKNYSYNGSDFYCGTENGEKKCYHTSKYGYGIYTYMYTDLPIVSSFLKIPIYLKTKDMIESRNLTVASKENANTNELEYRVFDVDVLPNLYWINEFDLDIVFKQFAEKTLENYGERVQGNDKYYGWLLDRYGYGIRTDNNVFSPNEPITINSVRKYNLRDLFKWANSSLGPENATTLPNYYKNACGYQVDWSLY